MIITNFDADNNDNNNDNECLTIIDAFVHHWFVIIRYMCLCAFHSTRTTSIVINWKSDEQQQSMKISEMMRNMILCRKQNKIKKKWNLKTKIKSMSRKNDEQSRIREKLKKKIIKSKPKERKDIHFFPRKDSSSRASKSLWMIKLWKAFFVLSCLTQDYLWLIHVIRFKWFENYHYL